MEEGSGEEGEQVGTAKGGEWMKSEEKGRGEEGGVEVSKMK